MARLSATLGLLLTAALVAGCASAPSTPVDAGDRLSVGPAEDASAGPTRVVALAEHAVLGTPAVDHVFGVDIPEEALALRATLVIDLGAVQGLRLGLPGCMLLRVPSASTPAATVTLVGECEPEGRGLQQATLAFAAGAFVGTLGFEAVVPA